MTIHWKSIGKQGRIEALKAAWFEGCTMTKLGERLGISKGAIAGFYSRHPEIRDTHPLDAPKCDPAKLRGISKGGGAVVRVRPKRKPAPASKPARVWTEAHRPGVPLMMLAARQCKWPVNDAAKGEDHLFCALPTDGASYCAHHASRAFYRPIDAGRTLRVVR